MTTQLEVNGQRDQVHARKLGWEGASNRPGCKASISLLGARKAELNLPGPFLQEVFGFDQAPALQVQQFEPPQCFCKEGKEYSLQFCK